ncbi:hypothetical protein [Streptomyces sp. NPDC052127]|uniref:hypothetical protein n=1 Tax=Streptomyces sp. NPDC052127 TaxID=3155679 RepID=UPI00343D534C
MVNVDSDGDVAVRGSSWYQRMSAHVAHLQGQLNKFVALRVQAGGISAADEEIVTKVTAHLNAARTALQGPEGRKIRRRMSGAPADRALANMHEAEVALLRIAPREELRNKGFYALSHAWLHLGRDEELPRQLEAALYRGTDVEPAPGTRELAAITLHAAYQAEEAERARVRSFTHMVVSAAGVMWILAVALGVWAAQNYHVAEIFCFPVDREVEGSEKVCPLGDSAGSADVFFLEFIGMLAAAVAGAVSLKDVRGTAGPYHVATGLIILRLPVGALLAAGGILLMSGEFFPGLTRLDTPTQVIAWGFAFGILQESLTRAVDRQGRSLLDNIKGPGSETAPPSNSCSLTAGPALDRVAAAPTDEASASRGSRIRRGRRGRRGRCD